MSKTTAPTAESVFSSAGVGIALVSCDGQFLDVNPALAGLLGAPSDDLFGTPCAFAAGPADFEYERDGTWLLVNAAPADDGTLLVHAFDITARKAAEAALAEHESTFRTIFEDAHVGIALVNSTGHFLQVNRAHAEMQGTTPEELAGKHFSEVVPPELRETNADEHAERSADAAVAGADFDVPFLRTDGTPGVQRVSYSIIRDAADQPLHNVVQVEDITEQRRAEQQLLLSQKLESIGQLGAGIAHEINTPIQFVGDSLKFVEAACVDLLAIADACESGDAARIREELNAADVDYLRARLPAAIERAGEGVQRVTEIVRAMREFAEPHTGGSVDINRALENALVVTRNSYACFADVQTDFGADVPPVNANSGELNQVFVNLIVNAAHAIEERDEAGTITVSTRCAGDAVVVSITDTGVGIPAELQERVFDPFFTTKEVGRGTGQGLALARSIVCDRHGGTLVLVSVVGRGTTFEIRLPAAGAQDGGAQYLQ
jgi:two-component system, NtrC family, sensor kinase